MMCRGMRLKFIIEFLTRRAVVRRLTMAFWYIGIAIAGSTTKDKDFPDEEATARIKVNELPENVPMKSRLSTPTFISACSGWRKHCGGQVT